MLSSLEKSSTLTETFQNVAIQMSFIGPYYKSPLVKAAKLNQLSHLMYFVEIGYDINQEELGTKLNPIGAAILHGHTDLAKAIILNAAEFHPEITLSGSFAFHSMNHFRFWGLLKFIYVFEGLG